jgi:alpha-L-fucosidase
MFSDAGPDVRWIGNERGVAGETNWSTVDPAVVSFPGQSGPGVTAMLQHGDPGGSVWRPGETDVSIRPGWFHHPADDARVKSVDDLISLYFSSVGRNSKLLLNVPPTRDGLLHETDIARLAGMRERLTQLFARDLASGRSVRWQTTGDRQATWSVDLEREAPLAVVDLREDTTRGQTIAKHVVEGSREGRSWLTLATGTTIGYRRLHRLPPGVPVRHVRVKIDDAVAPPQKISVRLFATPDGVAR